MMSSEMMSEGAVRLLRAMGLLAGLALVLAALLADSLGLSSGSGFSRNQLFIGALGSGLVLASLLGRRSPRIWRNLALMVLNLLALLFIAELLSLAVIKIWNPREIAITARKAQEHDLARVEVTTVPGGYVSYLVWEADPELSGLETSDALRHRTTPGSIHSPEAYQVWTFGGSAMWGAGVPDSSTIAAYLQCALPDSLGMAVQVTNYGQMSWVSSQELICLLLELRDGRIPDLVIFYDGFNDVWSSYQNGSAGEHQNLPQITERVEGRDILRWQDTLLSQLFARTNIGQLAHLISTRGTLRQAAPEVVTYATMGVEASALAESTFAVYHRNMDAVAALGRCYGFDCLFYWQPAIWCGDKPRTAWEDSVFTGGSEAFLAGGDPDWKELLTYTQSIAGREGADIPGFEDLSGVFDSTETEVYSDFSGCHLNPWGNRLIATRILRDII